ncbi:MAG: DsbA family protein, partial [Woeseiaceae bacterium]
RSLGQTAVTTRKLRSLYLNMVFSRRYRLLRRLLAEMKRRATFKPHVVSVFLQIDDPYSYLLSHYLPQIAQQYKDVELHYYLCQALRHEYMPAPDMLAEYAVMECRLLAKEFDVPFLDKGDAPVVEHRRALLDFLAEEQEEEDFPETFGQALGAYWRGDEEGVVRLLGRTQPERPETNILISRNQLLLRKLGHYNTATMHYAGEWYWGVDRLHYLTKRFDALGLNRWDEPNAGLASLKQARQLSLPAATPGAADNLPSLEMFHSFRSPYSYLALKRTFEIADAFGLELEVRPVLPMVMRGMAVPKPKLLYIAKDANREARRFGVPFGKLADPVGLGAERCIAAFYYAKSQGRERDFLVAAGEAIWAEAIDVAEDEGMQVVAERSGLFWPDVKAALGQEEWRLAVEENRQVMTEAGVWGVPSFRIGSLALWGQDRDWLLARKIEDMCHAGDGIMV